MDGRSEPRDIVASTPYLRVAVVGAGGVGGLLGALLIDAGQSVGFLVRSATVRSLRAGGLRVVTPEREIVVPSPEAAADAAALGRADAVLLCTKTYDLEDAARSCAPIVDDGTLVITLQNGVEAEAIARRALPGRRVLPGLVYVTSTRAPSGEIRQSSPFVRLAFGPRSADAGGRAAALEAACRRAGIDATLADDMQARLWAKLLFLASMSAITASRNLRVGAVRADADAWAAFVAAMREVQAVGRAHGVALPVDAVEQGVALAESLPPEATSSMHEDLLAGRRLEIEFLSGAVVRLGREGGVPTPVHAAAYAILKPHAAGRSGPRLSARG
jgi:2-dehydropantoate 2-reductase